MKVLFELQNINGNYADVVAPDGMIILSQWHFPQFPQEHVCSGGSGGDSLAGDLISLKSNGIKIKYDDDQKPEES